MKKILLSSGLVILFAVYVLQQHLGGGRANFVPAGNSTGAAQAIKTNVIYKDGQYTGNVADAYYGNVQVEAVVQNGKISDVQFLNHPQDRSTSIQINNRAMPILKSEAIQSQSANVAVVSGATDTSQAFMQSLSSALNQAS